jgi:hypothetical protein
MFAAALAEFHSNLIIRTVYVTAEGCQASPTSHETKRVHIWWRRGWAGLAAADAVAAEPPGTLTRRSGMGCEPHRMGFSGRPCRAGSWIGRRGAACSERPSGGGFQAVVTGVTGTGRPDPYVVYFDEGPPLCMRPSCRLCSLTPPADPHAGWCGEGRLEAGRYPTGRHVCYEPDS